MVFVVPVFNLGARGEEMSRGEARRQKISAVRSFLSDASAHENELTDSDWNEMANLRSKTNASLEARMVEL